MFLFFILILIALPLAGQAMDLEKFHASPDRVLVLYNEDWEKDVDGSEPGQDSKEVAEYYVEKHSDSIRGLKPYILGLKCTHSKPHQKHLNNWYIEEKSQDNKNGVLFKGKGFPPGKKEWARDSRHVEIVVDNKDGQVDWSSVRIWCSSLNSKEKIKVNPIVSGAPLKKGNRWVYPSVEESKGRCFRFDAHKLFAGTVLVLFEVKDTQGKKIRDLKLKYYDRDDFSFSMFGRDGISDEMHFQEDIAIPIKQFLEDPHNALPDGTSLKEHILYIVVCHGLPFSSEGVFGIERGVTHNSGGHGDLGSLEQRLQTLYYGWGRQIVPPVVSRYMSDGPDSKKGVRNYVITSAMRYPMYGKRWNIYMHPDTYSFLGSKKKAIELLKIPPFPKIREKAPEYFFGYGVSRIDGQGPKEAKRIVDYALYASRYLRPEMIRAQSLSKAAESKKTDVKLGLKNVYQGKSWGLSDIPELGFEKKPGQRAKGLPFLKFSQDISMNRYRYLPGGMDRVVDSGNGWNINRNQPIWKQVDEGVTISACGGPAYGGGPHITNATFWDNRILMRYLFRGRDLGECFLLSTTYVNWSTSLVGDPLYHPDLSKTVVDTRPPVVSSKDDIQVDLFPTMGKFSAVIKVPLQFSKENPEVVIQKAYYRKDGEEVEQSVSSSIFSVRPVTVIRGLEADSRYLIRLVLTDPYGNETDLSKQVGYLTVNTDSLKEERPVWRQIKKRNNEWKVNPRRMKKLQEQGTIQIQFEAGKDGLLPTIKANGMYLKFKIDWPKGASFKLGGVERHWSIKPLLEQGEKATMLVRWRRYPLTREILLKAADGTEFPLIADNRTPWEKMVFSGPIRIVENKEVNVLSASIIADAEAASEKSMGVEVLSLKKEEWIKAQQKKSIAMDSDGG